VVNKSFGSNVTLGGVPARIIAEKGAKEQGVFSGDTINTTIKDLPQSSFLNQ
jgi:serine acetyltransferase